MYLHQQSVMSGLNSDHYKISVAGVYSMYASATELPPSGLVITLSQSGSASVSFVTPVTSPVQQVVTINGKFNCAIGDILTIAVTSAAGADQPPNMIKTSCILRAGL
jgi:hypothetical protein